MLDTQPEVGSTANRYEVLAKLASGGMAEIYLARTQSDAGVERYVVLKRVHKHRATDIKFVHMFLDEARLASLLQHPNIAQVFDTGKLGDSYFFTMEYVHGETVRELLHRSYELRRPIPVGCTLTIIAGAAAALQHAHDRVGHDGRPLGIVHRDVSPSNLIVSYEGNVKIVDFGVAKAAHRSVETQSGTVKGKMGYMAPEQCRGGDVDRRCDLFSLGIVMWELLVGERLFKRATDFESMEAVVNEPTPPPSSLRPDLPPALDAVVLKLLAKRPLDRYQSADEVLDALEEVATATGFGISVAAVRRYIRELFGTPHEPWVELRRGTERSEAVTVTGAPINGLPGLLELEGDALDKLRDLSTSPLDSMPIRMPAAAVAAANAKDAADDAAEEANAAARRRWRWAIPLVGAAIAIGATVYVVTTRERSGDAGTPPVASRDVPGAQIGSDAAPTIPSAVATNGSDTAAAPSDVVAAQNASDAPTAERTGAAAAQNASDAAPGPSDAPAAQHRIDAVTTAPADAGGAHDGGDAAADASGSGRPSLSIPELVRARRFAEVIAACQRVTVLPASTAVDCTLAACREHDAEAASGFLAHVTRRKQPATVAACARLGTPLRSASTTTAKDPPKVDPPDDRPPPPVETGRGSGAKRKPACNDPDPMACRE